jgi:ribosomal protein S18 acetylase RimI-like enzyme
MLVREATLQDIPLIRSMARSIWMAVYPSIISIEQIEYMLERGYSDQAIAEQMSEGHHFLIPSLKDEPTGFLSYSHQGENRYFLHKFYIDPQQHRGGLGGRLFLYLLQREPDLKEIRLTVNRQNFKAINFYFRNGFTIEEVKDFDIGNGYVMNDFIMLYRRPAD